MAAHALIPTRLPAFPGDDEHIPVTTSSWSGPVLTGRAVEGAGVGAT